MFKDFKNNNYDQKLTKLRQNRDKFDQHMSNINAKQSKTSLQLLRKTFREPAREARRPPETAPSSGARSAPELGTSSRGAPEPGTVSGALILIVPLEN